jgi:hypothetical protein
LNYQSQNEPDNRDWLSDIEKNRAKEPSKSNRAIIEEIQSGVCDIGIISQYNLQKAGIDEIKESGIILIQPTKPHTISVYAAIKKQLPKQMVKKANDLLNDIMIKSFMANLNSSFGSTTGHEKVKKLRQLMKDNVNTKPMLNKLYKRKILLEKDHELLSLIEEYIYHSYVSTMRDIDNITFVSVSYPKKDKVIVTTRVNYKESKSDVGIKFVFIDGRLLDINIEGISKSSLLIEDLTSMKRSNQNIKSALKQYFEKVSENQQ